MGSAPGRGAVIGPGCDWVCGTLALGAPGTPCGGMPGNCPTTGLFCGGGIATLIGSSSTSTGTGGRWNVGGAMLLAVAAGGRLVGMIVTRSYIAALAKIGRRGAAI